MQINFKDHNQYFIESHNFNKGIRTQIVNMNQLSCLPLIMGRNEWNKGGSKASVMFYFFNKEIYKHIWQSYSFGKPVCSKPVVIGKRQRAAVSQRSPQSTSYVSLFPPVVTLIDCLGPLVQCSLFLSPSQFSQVNRFSQTMFDHCTPFP